MSSKTKQDLICGSVIYAVLLGAFYMSTKMLPETALFPKLIISTFAILNTIMIIQAFKASGDSSLNLSIMKMPILYFISIAIYVVLFSIVGYFPSTIIMLVSTMYFMKVRPYWIIAAVTAGYMAFVYVLFIMWLKVSLL
ncbi:tripartite tricarboxylate transporter TctB family protein [Oscillospiraceae bacterium LTW-04]|nr:tripartite tricarboxylate transporter TctB family protein [Oscillospiraceae bacterium MB24-C1]